MSVTQINPQDAFALLKQDESSILIDVRTNEEFNFVGFVDPKSIGDRVIILPWKIFPEMSLNNNFGAALEQVLNEAFGDSAKEMKLLFLCRSGGRSQEAAQHCLSLGFKNCYNITSGFEGDLNQDGHRGKIGGWKFNNLPWKQF